MVQIKSVEEYDRIKESNYGFLIIPDIEDEVSIHSPSCNILGADDYIEQRENESESINMHWFSTISLAEKKFSKIKVCNICKPE